MKIVIFFILIFALSIGAYAIDEKDVEKVLIDLNTKPRLLGLADLSGVGCITIKVEDVRYPIAFDDKFYLTDECELEYSVKKKTFDSVMDFALKGDYSKAIKGAMKSVPLGLKIKMVSKCLSSKECRYYFFKYAS